MEFTIEDTAKRGIGDIIHLPGNPSSVSFGPTHNKRPIAKLWRFWTQGDEFYLAQRDAAQQTKVSFHSGGNWHSDTNGQRTKLAPPFALGAPGWAIALQLKFLVYEELMPESVVLKKLKKSTHCVGVEVNAGHMLCVNILTAPAGTTLESPVPRAGDGVRFMSKSLRSGDVVMLTGTMHPMGPAELARLARLESLSVEITATGAFRVPPTMEYVSLDTSERGNVLCVVPIRREALKVVVTPRVGTTVP